MRHYCSNCSSEFFDDAPSASPPSRVFCVFCGIPLPAAGEDASGVPFSSDFPRSEGSALGVIGNATSDFPDTLKQFRAHAGQAPPRLDSLSPLQTETEPPGPEPESWRASRFWASLAIGFGVGAVIAAVLSQREAIQSSAPAARAALPPPPVASLAVALPGCVVASAAPAMASAAPSIASKPAATRVTPALERRFWLDRARTAQREYRLPDAERFYRRVLALSPRDSEALTGVGELELLRGAPVAAGERFQDALAANADYLPALVALADLHWQAGEAEAAREGYRNIVEHYSDDLYPPYVKQRLETDTCVPQCR